VDRSGPFNCGTVALRVQLVPIGMRDLLLAWSGLAYGGNKLRKLEYIVPDVTWLAPCGKGGPPTS
jgi:hypothetical protein